MCKQGMNGFGSWERASVDMDLGDLSNYHDLMERCLAGELQQFQQQVEQQAARLDADQQAEFYDWHQDDHWRLSEVFPRTMRASWFLVSYSFLEHELHTICNRLKKENGLLLSHTEIKGAGIEQAHLYLKRVARIPFPDQCSEWQDIKKRQIIRNAIAHRDARLTPDESRQLVSFLQTGSIKLGGLDQVELSPVFCADFIGVLQRFFNQLFDGLDAGA